MANPIVLNYTNMELFAANTQKKQEVQHINIQYNGQNACILSIEDVKKRRLLAKNKKKEKNANS